MLHQSNKCGIQFRCQHTKEDTCILYTQSERMFGGERSVLCKYQVGLNCTSAVAQAQIMTLALKELK